MRWSCRAGSLLWVVLFALVSGPARADMVQICDQPRLRACFDEWNSVIIAMRDHRVPELQARKTLLPTMVQSCSAQLADANTRLLEASNRFSGRDGAVRAYELALSPLREAVGKLQEQRALFDEMRPLIEKVTPALMIDLRQFLTAHESALEAQIALLIDEIERTPEDSPARDSLSFQLEALVDLKALRIATGGSEGLTRMLGAPWDSEDGRIGLELLSPLSRALILSAGDMNRSYGKGLDAFLALESAWDDVESSLSSGLTRLEAVMREEVRSREAAGVEVDALARAAASRKQECQSLEKELASGIDAEIRNAWAEHDRANAEWNRCEGRFCRWEWQRDYREPIRGCRLCD